MANFFVYKITNTVNSLAYVGKTTKPVNIRWNEHRTGRRSSAVLQEAILEFGIENFQFEVLLTCSSETELAELEIQCIRDYNTLYPNGYNRHPGGKFGGPNVAWNKGLGEFLLPEVRERVNQMNTGRVRSLESRRKQSETTKGQKRKPFTEEHRQNLSRNHADFSGEKNPFYDKTHTKETREILSRPKTEEHKQKLRGPKSPEHCKNISLAKKGKPSNSPTKIQPGQRLSPSTEFTSESLAGSKNPSARGNPGWITIKSKRLGIPREEVLRLFREGLI